MIAPAYSPSATGKMRQEQSLALLQKPDVRHNGANVRFIAPGWRQKSTLNSPSEGPLSGKMAGPT